MKFGVVINKASNNYGDDIQTIAAANLLPFVDYYFDRENLNNVRLNEEVKTIVNGWYMYEPKNWPPHININPLFISFHVTHNNSSDKLMINGKLFDYYKKYEPIGCRDYHTMKLFKKIGIKSYFIGCLTLTLENSFSNFERNDEILFVDPLSPNIPYGMKNKILKKIIPDSIKKNIHFIEHDHSQKQKDSERLKIANNLLNRYSKAHLIVTSRIHAALPAMALGTPVLFLDLGFNNYEDRNRFGGLIELFNTIDNSAFSFLGNNYFSKIYRKLRLYDIFYYSKPFKFDWDNPPKPTDDIKIIAENIKRKVNEFIEK